MLLHQEVRVMIQMYNTNSTFTNVYKKLYIASKDKVTYDDYNNELISYKEPFYFGEVNYQYLSGNDLQAYMSVYGETKNKLVRAFIDICNKGKIKEFDLAYLFDAEPSNETISGQKANYIVKTVAEQNTKIMIIFEEIIKGE